MESRFHSVKLLEEKCKGCTNCIKRCPTEAIRVREGKAVINAARCIDCGECVRTCENHAKTIIANSLEDLREYDYTIALPAPALYSQLERASGPDEVVWGLQKMGFDEVCDVSFGADIITECTRRHLMSFPKLRPVISGACPAVVRLIQVRYPNLLSHVVKVESPMYAAARVARAEATSRLGIADERIGVFFITPCAAKVTAVIAPLGSEQSYVNGAISISDIYGDLITRMGQGGTAWPMYRGSSFGFGWANSSGELKALGLHNVLAVDGIHNVLDLLEEVDNGRLAGVDYIEALACPAGCVGGPATVENPFVARARMIEISKAVEAGSDGALAEAKQMVDKYGEDFFGLQNELTAVASLAIDPRLEVAIAKMSELERVLARLPGLDCGACGSPTCRAHAEDVVCGYASEVDCVFRLREAMEEVAEELLKLAKTDLPSLQRRNDK